MTGIRSALVVGAGIGGLTTAVGLRRAGIDVHVVERRAEPDRLLTGGAFMLWHNAVLALRQLGLDEPVIAGSSVIHHHEFRSDRDRRLARWQIDPHARRFDAPAIALRRSVLNTVLMDAVGADTVTLGAACADIEQDPAGVTAVLADGTRHRADVLIGADGLRSAVRSGMRHGFDLPPRYARYTAWQAITELSGENVVPSGTFFNYWGRDGLRFLYCRLNEREVYWDAITSDRVSARFDMLGSDKRGALMAAYRNWPAPVPQIIASTAERAVLPVAMYDRPPTTARSWGWGRVVLVGDAAHPQTLNLSQGAGQAIEDGVLLARLLAERDDPVAAIAEFEQLRRDRVAAMVRMAWRIGLLGHVRSAPLCAARDVVMRLFFNTAAERGTYRVMMDGFLDRAPAGVAAAAGSQR